MDKWLAGNYFLLHPANRAFVEPGNVGGGTFPLISTRSMMNRWLLILFVTMCIASLVPMPAPRGIQNISLLPVLTLIFLALIGFNLLKDFFYATFSKPIDATPHTVQIRYEGRKGKAFNGWKMDIHYEFVTPEGERLEKIEIMRFGDLYRLSSTLTPPNDTLSHAVADPILGHEQHEANLVQYAFNEFLREHRPKVRVQFVNSQFFRAM